MRKIEQNKYYNNFDEDNDETYVVHNNGSFTKNG